MTIVTWLIALVVNELHCVCQCSTKGPFGTLRDSGRSPTSTYGDFTLSPDGTLVEHVSWWHNVRIHSELHVVMLDIASRTRFRVR